jgi:hypothetical protein
MKITALLCIALLLTGCGSYEPDDEKGRAKCYQTEFGTPPPEGITNILAKQIVIRDSARVWLRFEATPALVDSLLKGFAASDRETFDEHAGGENSPAWWTPDRDKIVRFHLIRDWNKDFTNSSAVIAHDAEKRVVYFCHDAFD